MDCHLPGTPPGPSEHVLTGLSRPADHGFLWMVLAAALWPRATTAEFGFVHGKHPHALVVYRKADG